MPDQSYAGQYDDLCQRLDEALRALRSLYDVQKKVVMQPFYANDRARWLDAKDEAARVLGITEK